MSFCAGSMVDGGLRQHVCKHCRRWRMGGHGDRLVEAARGQLIDQLVSLIREFSCGTVLTGDADVFVIHHLKHRTELVFSSLAGE